MILKRKPPKAYYAREKDGDCATIVFAQNATEAKQIAKVCDCCEDARYIDIRVRRMPEADKLYKDFPEIEWYDAEIRVALVRDFGWQCFEPSWECDTCPAKPYCYWHKEEEV
jgi:hypothetical protein